RGPAEEDQVQLLSSETNRRLEKQSQVALLASVLATRGESPNDTISPEEFQLADAILRFNSSPATSAANPMTSPTSLHSGEMQPRFPVSNPPPTLSASFDLTPADDSDVARATIRVHVYLGRIEQLQLNSVNNSVIDCMSVGHYLRVKPSGAELDLDY